MTRNTNEPQHDELVRTYVRSSTGILELNRPKALNAINPEMVDIITAALEEWRDDPEVHRVLIFSNSPKGFCAGGDIRVVRNKAAEGDQEFGDRFLQAEYAMNVMMANYPKPYVALIDGVVMGGGLGASAHGSHRIVTEKAFAAMPEMAIGFVPDVGMSYMMTHMVGEEGHPIPEIGVFAGLTGYRLKTADMLFSGLATHYVPSEKLGEFHEMLIAESIDEALDEYAEEFTEEPELKKWLPEIIECFSQGSWHDIELALENCDNRDFVHMVRELMGNANPSSVVAAAEMYNVNKNAKNIEQAIHNEYEIGYVLRREPNFIEGVRAVLVDKDRNPNFEPATMVAVDAEHYRKVLS